MFRIHKYPTIGFLADILAALEGLHMDENKIWEGIDIESEYFCLISL